MRTLLIAGTALASLIGAEAAVAGQRMVQHGPGMTRSWTGPRPMTRPTSRPMMAQQRAPRWGSKVGGRWWGGANAPGGWNAYRRPVRGWALPVYWNTPRFYVSDWATYGLSQPQPGYNWVRYYDDAVLVDSRGSVFDTRADVDWDRYDGDGYADDQVYADAGDEPPVAPDYPEDRGPPPRDRDNGVGGALAGAAVGGVAGAVIAGRGDRLGGALIGGGVGALTGYAIDKAEDRGRRAPPPPMRGDYGAGYPVPGPGPSHGRPMQPLPPMAPSGQWVSPDGSTTVVTSGGGYGGSVTTVTVQSAPVITTTTTEIYEDHVTWSKPVRKKAWRPRSKLVCRCR
jgi:Ni/Co efflux regulator RcnB